MRGSFLIVAGLALGCAGRCPEPAEQPRACVTGRLPAGRWSGDWKSHPLAHPDFVRTGLLDLTIGADGKLTGQTSEHDNPDTGSLTGSVDEKGHFEAKAVVMRASVEKQYALSGTFACGEKGPAGSAQVLWGDGERGNLEFALEPAQ